MTWSWLVCTHLWQNWGWFTIDLLTLHLPGTWFGFVWNWYSPMSTAKSPFWVSRTFTQTQILSTEVAYLVSRFFQVWKWKLLKQKVKRQAPRWQHLNVIRGIMGGTMPQDFYANRPILKALLPTLRASRTQPRIDGRQQPLLLVLWVCSKIGHPKAHAFIISFPKKRPNVGGCWRSLFHFQTNRSGFQPKKGLDVDGFSNLGYPRDKWCLHQGVLWGSETLVETSARSVPATVFLKRAFGISKVEGQHLIQHAFVPLQLVQTESRVEETWAANCAGFRLLF